MWNKILGHKKQIEQLKRTIKSKHLPSALLFSGIFGIGKSLIAVTFAKALFCKDSPEVCDKCIHCLKVNNRSHPDFFFIEPANEKILIDQVRSLQQDLQFHPLEGSCKVAIINDAESMTESAANSLLKILEEPPPNTYFILVSGFIDSLLPTIRSRCQKIFFSPLSQDEIMEYLIGRSGLEKGEASRLASLSQGRLGSILLDAPFVEEVLTKFKSVFKRSNAADLLALAESWSKEEKSSSIFDLLAGFYRDLLFFSSEFGKDGSKNGIFFSKNGIDEFKNVLGRRPVSRLERDFFSIINTGELLLNTTANKQLLFENLLFTLTN